MQPYETAIDSWENRHTLAREALLKCLDCSELIRVVDVEESAPAIWNRLREEFGHVLDIEYVRADAEFHTLKKDDKTPINKHLDNFITLLNLREYQQTSWDTSYGTIHCQSSAYCLSHHS